MRTTRPAPSGSRSEPYHSVCNSGTDPAARTQGGAGSDRLRAKSYRPGGIRPAALRHTAEGALSALAAIGYTQEIGVKQEIGVSRKLVSSRIGVKSFFLARAALKEKKDEARERTGIVAISL